MLLQFSISLFYEKTPIYILPLTDNAADLLQKK
jgi:hypothetical protein